MGRVKSLLCAFCLDRRRSGEHPYGHTDDVSHLATPHITSTLRSSANSTPTFENKNGNCRFNQTSEQSQQLLDPSNRTESINPSSVIIRTPLLENNSTDNNNNTSQPSPCSSIITQRNPPQSSHPQAAPFIPNHINNDDNNEPQIYDNNPQQRVPAPNYVFTNQGTSRPVTKLSYDIISVREPLAKILAEGQQSQNSQQRQMVSEHEYIEVYGERGSSCFYEEIAGSTTSSATYDQIGAVSNHNYQVLIGPYAQRQGDGNQADEGDRTNYVSVDNNDSRNLAESRVESNQINTDRIDSAPSTSSITTNHQHDNRNYSDSKICPIEGAPQSIPVYSVINKSARKSNAASKDFADRPPKPPPKNSAMTSHVASISAIPFTPDRILSTVNNQNASLLSSIPNTRYHTIQDIYNTDNDTYDNPKMPEPPPRFSKQSLFNANTNRPLPLPETRAINNIGDDDADTTSNGYELLSPVLDDDQIDVGYERIKEIDRYSAGSIASQLYNLQNSGYESVYHLYASPSNGLVEPNYEAIGPATASEMAAAATARLNAAAKVLQQDK